MTALRIARVDVATVPQCRRREVEAGDAKATKNPARGAAGFGNLFRCPEPSQGFFGRQAETRRRRGRRSGSGTCGAGLSFSNSGRVGGKGGGGRQGVCRSW